MKPVNKPGPLHIPHAKTAIVAKKPNLTPKEALKAKLAKHGRPEVAKKPEAAAAPASPAAATFDAALLEASWEGARAAVDAAGASAEQLVDAWTKGNNAAAVAAIAADEAAPGAARRAAKRGLAVLRSRGVTIPSAPKREARADAAGSSVEVTMRAPDGSGTRGFVFSQREPDGRFRIAEVIVQDGLGVVYAGAGWLSASGLKEAGKRVQQNRGAAPVAVPVPWARHEIAEAKKQNAASSQPLPLELARCKELVEPPPSEAPQHPLAELESTIDDAQATAMAATSMLLYQEPELGSWVAERRAVDDMLQQLGQRLGAEGANDPQKAGELLREEVLAAVDRFFASDARDRVVDRLRDVALSIRARKGDEAAKTVLGVAKAVKSAGLITQPPREIPFLVGLFDRAVSVLAQNGQLRIPSPRTA